MLPDLNRFHEIQPRYYETALAEIRRGRKESHWIWFIFPQLAGLGHSRTSLYYGIRNLQEARAYVRDPVLYGRLLEITRALLEQPEPDIHRIFWAPDDRKVQSCMTLFQLAAPEEALFQQVLDRFYDGERDRLTLELLEQLEQF